MAPLALLLELTFLLFLRDDVPVIDVIVLIARTQEEVLEQ